LRPPINQQAPHHFIRRWPRTRRRDREYRSNPLLVERLVSVMKRPVASRHDLVEELRLLVHTECPSGYSIYQWGELFDIVKGHEFHLATGVTYRKDERG